MVEAGEGYSNLEYDLVEGERGSRFTHLENLLSSVTGAEAGMAVNNNAAAVLLCLTALAKGKEVIVSRGQAVEIGGGFRIPDVMRQSGARLVEVGTTNRTYLSDYEAALGPKTGLLLRVHTSNFRVVGFTQSTSLEDLVALSRQHDISVLDDLGSGALLDTAAYGLAHEPMVQESVVAGANLVCFSGDKLLGGPQAGIIVGRRDLIERLRRHPLARALRLDKATIAGLAATLQHYRRGEASQTVPVWRMISASLDELGAHARAWASALTAMGIPASVVEARSAVGGGSLPEETLATCCLALRHARPNALAARLRQPSAEEAVPVVARVERDAVLFDPRTVLPEQGDALLTTIRGALET
jgi:L-seryl-tRNA(Ser) seleniumtransferase